MKRKTKIAFLVILIMSLGYVALAQNKVSLSIHQDARLGLLGDDKGNDAGTLNILARFKMQGKQQKGYGYLVVFPEFEYADIGGNYRRYSANVGYTFNELIVDNFEASLFGGWGFIDRYAKAFFSAGFEAELGYKITDRFKVSLLAQLIDRKDLKWMYGNTEVRFSGFIGIEYNLNIKK